MAELLQKNHASMVFSDIAHTQTVHSKYLLFTFVEFGSDAAPCAYLKIGNVLRKESLYSGLTILLFTSAEIKIAHSITHYNRFYAENRVVNKLT